ncbi:MAG: D-alanyl-D-alanine carboxypeptidase family protein [Protaetiibacter sp.]
MTEADAPALRPRRARLGRRARILVIAGGAVLLVLALVAGVLVAVNIDAQAAAGERRAAERAVADAEDALDTALERIGAASTALGASIDATDEGLTITGAGLDEAALPALREARAAAGEVRDADGDPVGFFGDRRVAAPEGDDRAAASALRLQAKLSSDDAKLANAQAERLEQAADELATAIGDYLGAAQTAGTAVLTERSDAGEDTRAALHQLLGALPTTQPTAFAETLTAYRAAVDAVIASSDAARTPASPGGTGIRVPDPASLTAVVNKRRGLAADYVPPGLVTPSGIPGATQVRSELVAPLERMRADMAAAGITLRMSSAYRSFARQQTIYNGFVAREGVSGADTHSARPGNSEHQTGLAVDLDDGAGCNLSRCFADTAGGRWLAANSWKYGFILRYGDGWQPIVGYTYEPWHFRYVGVDVATDMHDRGIRTLEEYFGLPAAPDYG